MKRFTPLLFGLGLLFAGTATAQTTHVVTVTDFAFSPASLTIEAGDTVRWENVAGTHNVNGTQATFPGNPVGFGNDVAPAPWNYEFTFQFAGDYAYQCDVHPAMMQGSVTVNAAATDSPLIISEYVEGTSNNKAIELYNTSGSTVDLDAEDYTLQLFFNGATTAGRTFDLTGSIAPGDVFVVAHSSADPAILAVADFTQGGTWYNGDDAIVLFQGSAVIDVIGRVGEDPGTEWGTGDASTADNTLRRELNSCGADTDPFDAFDPATIYSGFPIDTFDGLGSPGNLACGAPPSCPLNFAATINTTTANQGDQLTFLVSVQNPSPSPVLAALRLVATGPANQTVNFGSANMPAGATVINRPFRVRIPGNAPDGTYNLSLELSANGEPCASEQFTLTVVAPRVGEAGATAFELIDGTFAPASAVSGAVGAVGASPNPTHGQAAIRFTLGQAGPVRLAVYDALGREVAVLVDGAVEAGAHTALLDASALPAGVYVYRLTAGGQTETGRLTVVR